MTTPSSYSYRFIYFNVRGAGELCRYMLECSGADWEDVRYPMNLAAKGFSYGPEFQRDSQAGGFDCNMGNLPVLQILGGNNKSVALATVGQSHAIARFVAKQQAWMGRNDLEEFKIDAIYECCRDIKTAWYRIKQTPLKKKQWFATTTTTSTNDDTETLQRYCQKLEKVLQSTRSSPSSTKSRWALNTPNPTLADIAIYHLLGAPVSTVSGSTASFFGETEATIGNAYQKDCPLLKRCVQATSELPAIKKWERKRPDTFT